LFINGNACLQISQDGGKLENAVAPAGEADAHNDPLELPIVIKSFYTALFTCLGCA
jgi:hypothetical protein